MVSHQAATFGGYRHCGSRDKMFSVCHVNFQDYVIKVSCNFMNRSPSR